LEKEAWVEDYVKPIFGKNNIGYKVRISIFIILLSQRTPFYIPNLDPTYVLKFFCIKMALHVLILLEKETWVEDYVKPIFEISLQGNNFLHVTPI
jgi:hypothetical protein